MVASLAAGSSQAAPGPGVAAGSLIRRYPAGLFERARAELRAAAGGAAAGSVLAGPAGDALIRRTLGDVVPAGSAGHPQQPGAGDVQGRAVSDSLSSREWDQLVDEVVRRIEHRVTAELARRGRRSTPRTF